MPKAAKTQPFYKGRIPADWTVATFGELFDFLKTFSFSRDDLTYEKTESEVRYIHYGDVHSKFSGDILDFETDPEVPYLKDGLLGADTLGKEGVLLQDGDLVIADASEDYEGIGRCVELRSVLGRKVVAGLHVIALRSKSNQIGNGYSPYLIQGPETSKQIKRVANGVSVLGISKKSLESVFLSIPKTREQKFIFKLLHECDLSIQKSDALLAAKKIALQALKFKMFSRSDELGRLEYFGNLLKESSIMGKTGNHARKISLSLYGNGVYANAGKRGGSENTQYFIRRKGQLIYSKLDFLNGAFGLVPAEFDGFESTQDLPAFDIDSAIDPTWLLEYLIRPAYYTRQTGLARGQRIARRVNPKDFLKSKLRVPPVEFQRKAGLILKAIRCEIEILGKRRDAFHLQKRGLMQKLLTGEWRVKP